MVKSIFILLLSIGVPGSVSAQEAHSEKKVNNDSPNPTIGLKATSPASGEKKTVQKKTVPLAASNQNTTGNKQTADRNADAAKLSEIMKLDYHNMPANVQSKINSNKLQGKSLLQGVVKIFTVEIASCKTDADQKQILQFLKAKNGFLYSEFVSTGLVKIIVEPTFDSPDLKDAMSSNNIHFNFLNRSYALKN